MLPEIPSSAILVRGSYDLTPTPAPKKPLQEGYRRVKCKRCGQEYDVSDYQGIYPSEEEQKHYHITPEERARFQKTVLKLLKNQKKRS